MWGPSPYAPWPRRKPQEGPLHTPRGMLAKHSQPQWPSSIAPGITTWRMGPPGGKGGHCLGSSRRVNMDRHTLWNMGAHTLTQWTTQTFTHTHCMHTYSHPHTYMPESSFGRATRRLACATPHRTRAPCSSCPHTSALMEELSSNNAVGWQQVSPT